MKGFFEFQGDGVTTGLGTSSLKESEKGYNHLLALFGGRENMPSSVMKAKRQSPTEDVDKPAAKRSYSKTGPYSHLRNDRRLKNYTMRGSGCGVGALSTFPQNIGRSIVLLYSEPRQTVFDPFAGHNSRMDLCVKAGRNYIGCDLSTEFMEFNHKRAAVLRNRYPYLKIQLHHVDSREVPVKDNRGDFTITSPPYYDIEYYGDEPEQLGKSKTYEDFLAGLGKVLKENFRVLKPGSYAAWFVNDFRRNGVFYSYHIDVVSLAKEAGFVFHDLLVVDFGRGLADCFPNRMMIRKHIPKRHEYGLIFRKPGKEK